MPAPYTAICQARIIGSIHGSVTNNVIHFGTNTQIFDGSNLNPFLLQLATALAECVLDQLLAAVTQDWTFVRCEARTITPTLSEPVVFTPNALSVGELGPTNVSFVATLVNIRTGLAGRTRRGKIFLPPPGDNELTNSLVAPPTLTNIQAFLQCVVDKFINTTTPPDFELGVFSRKVFANNPSNMNTAFTPATQLSPNQLAARMGSRKVGRGA